MITQFEALELVSLTLRKLTTPKNPLVVLSAQTIEKPFGWIFFYNSKRFLETGLFRDRLAGAGPIVVHKIDGKVELVGASTWSEFIEKYESRFLGGRERRGHP
jgi:Immunity protein 35